MTYKFGYINRDVLTVWEVIFTSCVWGQKQTKKMKLTVAITLWLSQSSCAFSDTDTTTKGQADHHWWLYSQTLRHCRPKISTDTLGSHLYTSHTDMPISHSIHAAFKCCNKLLWSNQVVFMLLMIYSPHSSCGMAAYHSYSGCEVFC